MLSITTDYRTGVGTAEPYLREIARAGFTHVHWCQEWNTDYLYSDREIARICSQLNWCRLRVTDLHASAGETKRWGASDDAVNAAGIALVANRLRMAAMLACDVVVLHLPGEVRTGVPAPAYDAVRRALDALTARAREHGVRIALENMPDDNTAALEALFTEYGPDVLGLCYDSGHGHLAGNGLERLAALKDRLLAIHLHDNDGSADQHRLPFDGAIDWPPLLACIAASPYRKPINLEVSAAGCADTAAFLAEARVRGARLEGLLYAMRA
ncbi:MAG TPA: sugar phosphate isomerase/epimerase family protein [Armatimonadota bacterium]|nr:sugar phosphate isomerase/epimerase family protein [Armatimonadota bacterium]